jgi:ankyrin repeat protein
MKIRTFVRFIAMESVIAVLINGGIALPANCGQKETTMTSNADFLSLVTQGDTEKIRTILKTEPSLARSTDKDGVSALLKAVYYNRKEVVEILLAARNDLDIFEASATGRTARVEELIKKDRSQVNAFAVDGFYPLGLAVFFKHPETVKVLLDAGADVNAQARNAMKVRPIHAAAAAAQIDVTRALLERGADVNAKQEEGYTPLHEAAGSGKLDFARLFLDHGADINARTDSGKTPLTIAIEAGQEAMVKLLRERGASQ